MDLNCAWRWPVLWLDGSCGELMAYEAGADRTPGGRAAAGGTHRQSVPATVIGVWLSGSLARSAGVVRVLDACRSRARERCRQTPIPIGPLQRGEDRFGYGDKTLYFRYKMREVIDVKRRNKLLCQKRDRARAGGGLAQAGSPQPLRGVRVS